MTPTSSTQRRKKTTSTIGKYTFKKSLFFFLVASVFQNNRGGALASNANSVLSQKNSKTLVSGGFINLGNTPQVGTAQGANVGSVARHRRAKLMSCFLYCHTVRGKEKMFVKSCFHQNHAEAWGRYFCEDKSPDIITLSPSDSGSM